MRYTDPSGHKEGGRCEGDFDCEEEPEEEKDCLIYGNCSEKDLNKIYSESDLDNYGITQDEFVTGYKSYQYYQERPQEALRDCIDDTDTYASANMYSEYYLHQIYQPFDEGAVEIFIDQARESNDPNSYYSGLIWLTTNLFWQGADKGSGVVLENPIIYKENLLQRQI